MITEMRLTVRLKPLIGFRAKMRAEDLGITCAEYLRSLLEYDLQRGRKADALASLNAEITLVTAIMVRRILTEVVGEEDAKKLEAWATERAGTLVRKTLQERAGKA